MEYSYEQAISSLSAMQDCVEDSDVAYVNKAISHITGIKGDVIKHVGGGTCNVNDASCSNFKLLEVLMTQVCKPHLSQCRFVHYRGHEIEFYGLSTILNSSRTADNYPTLKLARELHKIQGYKFRLLNATVPTGAHRGTPYYELLATNISYVEWYVSTTEYGETFDFYTWALENVHLAYDYCDDCDDIVKKKKTKQIRDMARQTKESEEWEAKQVAEDAAWEAGKAERKAKQVAEDAKRKAREIERKAELEARLEAKTLVMNFNTVALEVIKFRDMKSYHLRVTEDMADTLLLAVTVLKGLLPRFPTPLSGMVIDFRLEQNILDIKTANLELRNSIKERLNFCGIKYHLRSQKATPQPLSYTRKYELDEPTEEQLDMAYNIDNKDGKTILWVSKDYVNSMERLVIGSHGVAGHWRHYSNGKTVRIRPHIRATTISA